MVSTSQQSLGSSTLSRTVYVPALENLWYAFFIEEVFELPEGHPDFGKKVAAYYYWIFPNMMFNFYPWGLSINIVKPIDMNKTRVSFISYVYDETKLDKGAGAAIDKVELEFLSFCETFQTSAFNGADVHKHVFAAAFLLDETEAFSFVEPLNGSLNSFARHNYLLHKQCRLITASYAAPIAATAPMLLANLVDLPLLSTQKTGISW